MTFVLITDLLVDEFDPDDPFKALTRQGGQLTISIFDKPRSVRNIDDFMAIWRCNVMILRIRKKSERNRGPQRNFNE